MPRIRQLILTALLASAALASPPDKPPTREMKQVTTRYYIMHTDMDRDNTREAAARMTAMAEEYHERTKGFAGKIARPLDFYLYSKQDDYYAAGGIKGSAGCYNGKQLMAIAGDEPDGETWKVVQHEGFHQFMHRVVQGRPPTFIEEGMAEYFAWSIFTGDGFVSGAVHPAQREMVQAMIKSGKQKPIERMLEITHEKWNDKIDADNYLQAWSVVQFLVHGDDGKYQQDFEKFLKAVAKGGDWRVAWRGQFGPSFEAFDKKWVKWWTELPEGYSADLYDRAIVATVTSFFARASSQKQTFETMDAFFASADAGELKCARDDWLPPALLTNRLKRALATGTWSIVSEPGKPPQVQCQRKDGAVLTGQFALKSGRVDKVSVQMRKPTTQPGK